MDFPLVFCGFSLDSLRLPAVFIFGLLQRPSFFFFLMSTLLLLPELFFFFFL